MNKYCAIVILYNPKDDVLERIQTYSKIFDKVIIVDNSTKIEEQIKDALQKNKSVEYCCLKENKGISFALNFAFKKGIEDGFDFMLTMDQDSVFPQKNIEYMINYIENNDNSNVGIYAPNFSKIYYNIQKQDLTYAKPIYPVNSVQVVTWAITSGSFIKLSTVKKILPIDENYFIAYVDIDLGVQMNLAGYSTLIIGKAILYQQIGNIVKKSALAEIFRFTNYASTRYYYLIRNNFYFRKKYKSYLNLRMLSCKQLAKYIFKIITSEKNKIEKVGMGYRGYCDYRKGLMGKKENID